MPGPPSSANGASANGSLKIGSVFGIPVRLHWSVLLLFVVFGSGGQLPLVLVLVGCVLLHELGHSLVARSFGIRVLDITFWPLGGMARMSELPEVPRIEGLVAIAGPAVNFALALLGVVAAVLVEFFAPGSFASLFAVWFIVMNLILGSFNLIPAFPMDGGRILRAWFARTTDWVTATEKAVRVGRFIAVATLLSTPILMIFRPNLCAAPLIALFVWITGGRELMAVRMRHGLSPFGGGRASGAGGLAGFGGMPGFGDAGPRFATAETAGPTRPTKPVPDTPPAGARRPGTWEPESPRGRFTEDEIRALERYHGRLQRRPPSD